MIEIDLNDLYSYLMVVPIEEVYKLQDYYTDSNNGSYPSMDDYWAMQEVFISVLKERD